MAKEKLKFIVAGKTVLYEGKPETRVKDLFDILVRMQVDSQVALRAYRDNIDCSAGCTDKSILQQFADAQSAYEERKKRKGLESANENGEEGDNGKPGTSEQVQKIILHFDGKSFSYDGVPSSKQNALIDLFIKKNATELQMVEAFRKNIPDCTASDEEICEMIAKAKEAKAARKAMKKGTSTGAVADREFVESDVNNNNNNNNNNISYINDHNNNENNGNEQQGTQQLTAVPNSGIEAIEEIAGMSIEERESISNFIKQVLEQKEVDTPSRAPEDSSVYLPINSIQRGAGLSSISAFCGVSEDDMLSVTSRLTRGKIAVYCQERNTVVNKVVHISPSTSYEEFCGLVEKKFGQKMALSFLEGEDMVEIDSEEVFALFFESYRTQVLEGKRMKIICTPLELFGREMDDCLSETNSEDGSRSKIVSDCRLQVRCVRTYTAHTSAVYCCSFSPKGDRFCTGSRDRSVRLWNTVTGGCSVMKGGHNGFVLSCDFSPRGNRIVSSSDDRTIKVWNTATCCKVFSMKGHEDKVYCVQYNCTGDYIVSASCDYTLKVWNAETGTRIVTLRGHTLGVFSCCFSYTDSGRYIVSGGDDRLIKVWEWAKCNEVISMCGHSDTVWSCKFSHDDSRIVTASMNHELRVWNWRSGVCLLAWWGHNVPIHHAVFSDDDNYIYSCARDWTVMVWDAKTGDECRKIRGHRSTVYHMDMVGNKLLTSSLDETLKLWTITEISKKR